MVWGEVWFVYKVVLVVSIAKCEVSCEASV